MTREEKSAARVRKLLELARDNPSIAEAANAFARAQEIAARHRLNLDDLSRPEPGAPPTPREVQTVTERVIERFDRTPTWLVLLAETIGRVNRCGCYYEAGRGGSIVVFGQSSDLDTVGYLYAAVRNEIDRLAGVASEGKRRSWGRNFRLGAVHEIGERLRQATQRAVRALQQEAFKAGGETALARVSEAMEHDGRVLDAVTAYTEGLGLRGGDYSQGSYGYGDGRRAGRDVSLGNSKGTQTRAIEGK